MATNDSASPGKSREAEPDPLINTVLGERYRVERRLSQGGMGVVYRARHVVLDSALAVKVLLKPQSAEDQRRFLQEAKLASLIQHPNTVQIIDFGVLPSGQSYLVMELLRGRTLASELRPGPLDPLRVCRIGKQIAHGLQTVHDQGIVHRDMKPDKVPIERKQQRIVPRRGEVLANHGLRCGTVSNQFRGSPIEQYQGNSLGPAVETAETSVLTLAPNARPPRRGIVEPCRFWTSDFFVQSQQQLAIL